MRTLRCGVEKLKREANTSNGRLLRLYMMQAGFRLSEELRKPTKPPATEDLHGGTRWSFWSLGAPSFPREFEPLPACGERSTPNEYLPILTNIVHKRSAGTSLVVSEFGLLEPVSANPVSPTRSLFRQK
jgi:hypothetical protein